MAIPKTYDPQKVESKWYAFWEEKGFFHAEPDDDRESYSVVIPPPNVTGVLHLGHTLNNTIQDVLVRRARLQGKNACWVPGTDHASIATEAKVVQMLRERDINKSKISRDEFLDYAWEWTEKYGGIILKQLRRLGASCDWERTRFTMEDDLYEAVIEVFVDLYEKGYIYRGERMINWDPAAQTALSDEEVEHKEVEGKLYHVRYQIEDADEHIVIATTRPETILGDTGICVHPDDERYRHLAGKNVLVPLIERSIPVVQDDFVDREFGTGCLKVTPAHDENDFEIGKRHNLKTIDTFNPDGTLNEKAQRYVGDDRMAAREKIVKDLEKAGQLEKVEDYTHKVGFSERTDVPIEPRLSLQWFCKMEELAKPALKAVMQDDIKFFPTKFKNTYRHWMENIRDWCISRQLWWGHRIPAYYLPDGEFVVAETKEKALEKAKEKFDRPDLEPDDLRQDEDVLDTWFSSWLWPISVFDGFKDPENKDIETFYPTSVLVTAPDIIFFWVARMIMSGFEYRGKKPFENVYFTGMVRDKRGRKMSKSLGNSPDLFDLLDDYGADGVRTGVLFSSPAGNDLLFDKKQCEQGRNFCNKIWNAFRLVNGWEVDKQAEQGEVASLATKWLNAKLEQVVRKVDDQFEKFRISNALMAIYKFIWDDFCSWYLELVKPDKGKVDKETYEQTVTFFEQLLQLLHPFMPFVTEEIWQHLRDREEGSSIMVAEWPAASGDFDQVLIEQMELTKKVVKNVRNIRNKEQIAPKKALELHITTNNKEVFKEFAPIIKKQANVSSISFTEEKLQQAKSFIVDNDEFFVPLDINPEEERKKLKEELEYTKGFLQSVQNKLNNEGFVNNAPEPVVKKEKKKKADAEEKIRLLEENLERLNGQNENNA